MNSSWAEPIIEKWKSLGIELNPGATIEKIAKAEKEVGIVFPRDFKELYVQVNGFVNWDWTPTMFSLWPLERIVEEYLKAENLQFVGFCDWLINCLNIGFLKGEPEFLKTMDMISLS